MKVDDNDQNSGRCICPDCPTYNQCMRDKSQRLYCSRGKTDCNPEPRSCLCGDCPVWAEYGLGGYYFCVEGAAV